jgi:S-DNA-T family DNA segregation ATPase FtsK/SpoIIIE
VSTPQNPDPDAFDWKAAENELAEPTADVVDLDSARTRRANADPGATHFDVALDDEPERGGIPVLTPPTGSDGRVPIVPVGWNTWPNIKHSARQSAAIGTYRLGFHALRAPKYAVLAVFWAVVGAFRLTGRQIRWWWVTEQYGLRQSAADANDPQMWLKLHREVKATRAGRFTVLCTELLALLLGGPILYTLAPGWALLPIGAGLVAFLAHIGRPQDRPIVTPATVAGRFRRVNPDIILRAYYAAGLGHPDRANQQVTFAPPCRVTAPGPALRSPSTFRTARPSMMW